MISKESDTGRYPARGLYREVAAFDVLFNTVLGNLQTVTYNYAAPGVLPGDLVVMMFKPSLGFTQTPTSDLINYKFTVSTPGVVTLFAQNINSTAGALANQATYRITVLRKE